MPVNIGGLLGTLLGGLVDDIEDLLNGGGSLNDLLGLLSSQPDLLDDLLAEDGAVDAVLDLLIGDGRTVEGFLSDATDNLVGSGGTIDQLAERLLGTGAGVDDLLENLLPSGGDPLALVAGVLDLLDASPGGGTLDEILGLLGSDTLDELLSIDGALENVLNLTLGDGRTVTDLLGDLSVTLDLGSLDINELVTQILGSSGTIEGLLDGLLGNGGSVENILNSLTELIAGPGGTVNELLINLFGDGSTTEDVTNLVNNLTTLIFGPSGNVNTLITLLFGGGGTIETIIEIIFGGDPPPGDPGIELTGQTVNEFAVNNTEVGTLSGGVSYVLLNDAGGRFKIVGDKVVVADGIRLDFEQFSSHDLVIRATDGSGNTTDRTITVTVTDVNPENVTGDARDNTFIGGAQADTLAGGVGTDTLDGGAGNDTLDGGSGDDMLVGRAGDDTMRGGAGNDTYVVDSSGDVTDETGGSGVDRVFTSAGFTQLAAGIENLLMLGTEDIDAAGNELANDMAGNAGANTLSGGGGNDVLRGGAGNDTLIGGDGNDTFDGGTGADTMTGGTGGDRYLVDNAGDVINEAAGAAGGLDVINLAISLSAPMAANVENLIMLGSDNLGAVGNELGNTMLGNIGANALSGGGGNDILMGHNGNDTLDGGLGNDQLQGGLGADVMRGGAGDDNYFVDSTGDQTIEGSGAGNDVVRTTIGWTLGANIENLVVATGAGLTVNGNNLANTMVGNVGADVMSGGAGRDHLTGNSGNDLLIGGAGNDVLVGGAGADRFRLETTSSSLDFISDFAKGTDKFEIDNAQFTAFAANGVMSAQDFTDHIRYVAATGAVYYDADGTGGAAAVQIASLGARPASLSASDFLII